jgi:hypothetical protein
MIKALKEVHSYSSPSSTASPSPSPSDLASAPSMRPITLSRIIEICNMALSSKTLGEEDLIRSLHISRDRARELTRELERMKLLNLVEDKKYLINKNTLYLANSFETESWDKFNKFFYENYGYYRIFIDLLSTIKIEPVGRSIEELMKMSKEIDLPLNRISLEVLTNWCERLNVIQRNLYAGRFYILSKKIIALRQFNKVLENCYGRLNIVAGAGLKLIYVEIPKLREYVCEELHTSRENFDKMLLQSYKRNFDKMEFAGAPITTITKKSRFSIRTINYADVDERSKSSINNIRYQILSPKLDLEKKRKGIKVSRKEYYYIAIRGKLN